MDTNGFGQALKPHIELLQFLPANLNRDPRVIAHRALSLPVTLAHGRRVGRCIFIRRQCLAPFVCHLAQFWPAVFCRSRSPVKTSRCIRKFLRFRAHFEQFIPRRWSIVRLARLWARERLSDLP
jgi:hypothetical protein